MPLTNECKKCHAEVPAGDNCPRCGNRLSHAGEHLSVRYTRTPVTDWFSWNAMLRVVVPVVTLVLATAVLAEALAEGERGVISVLTQGLFGTVLWAFGALLLGTFLLLLLQGPEEVRCSLGARSVTASVYVRSPRAIQLYARLMVPSSENTDLKQTDGDWVCVHRVELPWAEIRRAQYWPEKNTILLYRPGWWQAMCIRCDSSTYSEAVEWVKSKLARSKRRKKRKR